jgi:predicted  nucleic acid-binding Zn-ribbon protein
MAKALNIPVRTRVGDVQDARRSRDIAKEELDRLKAEASRLKSEIEAKEQSATFIRSELPSAYAKLNREGNPVCPVCKVLIDKVMAEGCGITKETCDLHALHAEIEQKKSQLTAAEREITSLRENLKRLQPFITDAERVYADANRQLDAIERAYDTSSRSIHTAQQLKVDVARFGERVTERESTRLQLQAEETSLEEIRKELASFRQASSERIRQLSEKFDAVLRELVPGVCGSAKIDGNGLKLNVEWGGDRSTAALDSLKVVVFDLAVLIMSMEQTLFLPGMLVHDSPREADLSATVYSRLFTFASKLEKFTAEPYFQYVITTTTSPPPDFQQKPWLALSIKGAPGEERLLGVDL